MAAMQGTTSHKHAPAPARDNASYFCFGLLLFRHKVRRKAIRETIKGSFVQDIYDGLAGSLGHESQAPAKDPGIKFTFSWWGVG